MFEVYFALLIHRVVSAIVHLHLSQINHSQVKLLGIQLISNAKHAISYYQAKYLSFTNLLRILEKNCGK